MIVSVTPMDPSNPTPALTRPQSPNGSNITQHALPNRFGAGQAAKNAFEVELFLVTYDNGNLSLLMGVISH